MPQQSAGILLYRFYQAHLEVLLVHPGGPFWARKDVGVWSIPKGLIDTNENPLAAAQREFAEETGHTLAGPFHTLQPIRQKTGKVIYAWATAGNLDAAAITSNTFTMEWPPKSGIQKSFPEVDKAGWFDISTAREKILPSQVALLNELEQLLA
ncbi:Predicted NTP pyrophosphohydrolase, NUDIX family [Chitinophaga costaii]|uniref:Predicted NTP pyrophosphohydrolase, NUDIX family n=1 Tax=Chitinophaga costaii TaxID=1335309 RepID=A0A1C4CBR0_9BACT|nr:NUDIX domain-containing protein [Chitinophaga costaii]PUZ27157.1 NUDIX domain-containing protein [Chitinophaga costaii]SCC16423.1 Predicted NTP pyrophosphohydrolase, NUDIX family [Chitinophaga costaii]